MKMAKNLAPGRVRASGAITRDEFNRLKAMAEDIYSANRVRLPDVFYHMPSRRIYTSLFARDSGWHAISMLHVDPDMATAELATLLARTRSDGRLPHESVLPGAPQEQWLRRMLASYTRRAYDDNGPCHLVDPPSFIVAAEMVFQSTGDRGWLRGIWDHMERCMGYLLQERDQFGDELISIHHPWESGTDLSPQYYEALGLDPTRRLDAPRAQIAGALLYRLNARHGWDCTSCRWKHSFVFEDLTMNCIVIRACRSMAVLAEALELPERAVQYATRARRMMDALDRIDWDEAEEIYFPRFDLARPRLARVKTAASLLPLFTGLCSREKAESMVNRHLLEPAEFWTPYIVPFNPTDELAKVQPWVERRLWSGHCIWMNFNWMLAVGLEEHGFSDIAREVAARSVRMILRSGFWEFYDSRTGAGCRTEDFTWPGLALDLVARFWPESTGA